MEVLSISILAIAIICSCLASSIIYLVFIRRPHNRIVPITHIDPIPHMVPIVPIVPIEILEAPKTDDPCNNI